jgi:hypothetical protein
MSSKKSEKIATMPRGAAPAIHLSTSPTPVGPLGSAASSAAQIACFCRSPLAGGTLVRSLSSNSTSPLVSRSPITRCASAAAHQRA